MNEDLVEAIDKATAAHALWKVRLIDAAKGLEQGIDRKTAGDCHACEFGRWLDGNRALLASHPEMASVQSRHQAFHEEVGINLDKIAAGRGHEVSKSLNEDGELRVNSCRMVLELLHWRERLAG